MTKSWATIWITSALCIGFVIGTRFPEKVEKIVERKVYQLNDRTVQAWCNSFDKVILDKDEYDLMKIKIDFAY